MPQFTLNFFGKFEVSVDAVPVTGFHSDKARALLAYLALEPQLHSRRALAALLWPDIGDTYARTNLRNTLHRLRQTLDAFVSRPAGVLLAVTRQTVQFNAANAVVDVLRFQNLLGAASVQPGQPDQVTSPPHLVTPSSSPIHLAEAVALYQGELLAGFGVADAPAFEEWLLLRRELLHQQALLAFRTLATGYETAGDYERAHTVASRLLALDPYSEGAYGLMMRLLARMGQPDQALRQFEQMRQRLRTELGVDPSEQTLTLARQIAVGEFGRGEAERPVTIHESQVTPHRPDLGEVPNAGSFFGRTWERQQIAKWLVQHRCRIVAVLGSGGIGKTTLVAQCVREVADHFEIILWRSLLNAPPLEELLPSWLQILSGQQLHALPESLDEQLRLLLGYLRDRRVLLVLDNMESILEAPQAGAYRAGYESYGQLIQQVATHKHQSHLLLTSRERPRGYSSLEGDGPLVQALQLSGLDEDAGRKLLAQRGVRGARDETTTLIERYSGNPLALKLVADTVDELYLGDIKEFLAGEALVFDDIRSVLDQQFARLSALEREVLFWLAVSREPMAIQAIRADLLEAPPQRHLVEALRNLLRRSLIEPTDAEETSFGLQNVMMEYLTSCLTGEIKREIESEQPALLHRHALLKAQAKEYVRQSQIRLILKPIAERLAADLSPHVLDATFRRLLDKLRGEEQKTASYAAGNILNLLLQLNTDVAGYDFSHLKVRHAYLSGKTLPVINFSGADLTNAVFTDAFGYINAVAFSQDGHLLAAGTADGEIWLWDVVGDQLYDVFKGHRLSVRTIDFSPDGKMLASGSEDHTVRLWDVGTGQTLQVLRGHTGWVRTVVFSPGPKGATERSEAFSNAGAGHGVRQIVASGSEDHTVRLWDAGTGQTLAVLHGYIGGGRTVAFRPRPQGEAFSNADSHQTLAVVRVDQTVHFWDVTCAPAAGGAVSSIAEPTVGRELQVQSAHIHAITFSPDGQTLASGQDDNTIYLWDIQSGRVRSTLLGHSGPVHGLTFSPDGEILASSSADQSIRLWDIRTLGREPSGRGRVRHTLHGPANVMRSIAFSPDGGMLANGGSGQTVNLWDVRTGQLRRTLQGHKAHVHAIAFSSDGHYLAAGIADQIIRLWDVASAVSFTQHTSAVAGAPTTAVGHATSVTAGQVHHILRGHSQRVSALVFRPRPGASRDEAFSNADSHQTLVSGSDDWTIRLWDVQTGQTRQTLLGHAARVKGLAFSPDGKLLASSSADWTIRLWDFASIHVWNATHAFKVLHGHTGWVWSVAFSPRPDSSRQILASGSSDQTVRLWDIDTGAPMAVLQGHTGRVRSVAFSPDGQTLASGSEDRTVRLWDVRSGQIRHILQGHTDSILSIAFSPDGSLLASAGCDQSVCLWDMANAGRFKASSPLHLLQGHRNQIYAVAFCLHVESARLILASGSADETVILWDAYTGARLNTLRIPGPYEGMNITGVTGITKAQKRTLKALGAVEDAGMI